MKMKLSKSILAVVIATTMILTLSAYANTPIEVPQLGSEIPSNITEEREAKDISEGNEITIPSGLLLDDNEDRTVSDLEDQKKFNESKMLNKEDAYANKQVKVPEHKIFEYPVTPKMNEWAELNTYKDKVDALQIPVDILKTLSTEELLNIVLEYPLFTDIYAFDNYEEGLIFLSENFNGIKELLNRQDVDKVLFDLYTKQERTAFEKLDDLDLENSIKSNENGILFFSDEVMNEIDSISDLSKLEIFLSYEPIFQELSNDKKLYFAQNIDENLKMATSKNSLFKYHLSIVKNKLNKY